jgi:hypothetical protein
MRDIVANSKNTISVFAASAVVVLLITLIALISLSPTLQAQTSNVSSSTTTFHTNNNTLREVQVFSANSKPYNLTYGEWTARWLIRP